MLTTDKEITPTKSLNPSFSHDWDEENYGKLEKISDNSEDSDLSDDEEIDQEKKEEREKKVSSIKTNKNLSPNSSPITRRLSMRVPSVHISHNPEINEIENSLFLSQLLKEISTFPDPPVHVSFQKKPENNSTPIPEESSPSIRKVTTRWTMVANFAKKLASTNDNSNPPENGAKPKSKGRRGSKSIPNVSEDKYV
jgi:hypothetical protein